MAPTAGKYKLQHNENFVEYLKSLGIPEDTAVFGDKLRPSLEVKINGDTFEFLSDSGVKFSNIKFTIGKEFEDSLPTEHVAKSIAALDGDKIVVTSTLAELGLEGTRTYEFTDTGMNLIYTGNTFSGTAKRVYTKI